MEKILAGITVVNIGFNLPVPLASSRLTELGAHVIKIEPPKGDPFKKFCPQWYEKIILDQEVHQVDLKSKVGKDKLHVFLEKSDLFLTSTRPSSLSRMGLSWSSLHRLHPKLCMVSVVGYLPPQEEVPGHDLNYQAESGLLNPPSMPASLYADIMGAERVVQSSLTLILKRIRTGEASCEVCSLSESIHNLELPLRYQLTTPHGLLGGKLSRYNLYQTKSGWIALAALEEKFWVNLLENLRIKVKNSDKKTLEAIFLKQTATEWVEWAKTRDIPISAVKQ